MNGRQTGGLRSLFILVGFGTLSAVVANCGGDDTGSPPATGGSAGSSGSGGTVDGGTGGRDGGTGGDSSVAGDASVDRGMEAASASDAPPTDAQIAACNAALADSGTTPCLQNCFCNLCPDVATACLGLPACLNIARCALASGCLASPTPIAACTDSETCLPTIQANPGGFMPAVNLVMATCSPICLSECAGGDASITPDGTPGTDAEAGAATPDATGGEAEEDAEGPDSAGD